MEASTALLGDPASAQAAALWSALNLLVLLVLSLLVVRQRRRHRVPIGDGGVPEVLQASRAFGNAAEYAPAGIAALAVMALVGAPLLAVHVTGGLLLLGRLGHGVGLYMSTGPSLGRTVGMGATWTAYVFAIVVLLVYAIP